jgi:dipeptide transport system permease protein
VLSFLLKRLALVIPTFIGITLLAFSLIHLIPGDPVQVMAGERRLDPAFHAEVMHKLGLDRPLHEQYFAFHR